MYNVHARPCRELRNNYAELARLVKDRDSVIITNNGRDEAVLIGMDEFNAYTEFLHRRYISRELKKARAEADDADTRWLTEDEFLDAADRLLADSDNFRIICCTSNNAVVK
jgi:prevent-host-death family protein